jgi:hypothetical protein
MISEDDDGRPKCRRAELWWLAFCEGWYPLEGERV